LRKTLIGPLRLPPQLSVFPQAPTRSEMLMMSKGMVCDLQWDNTDKG
jgi:hypothetical protein